MDAKGLFTFGLIGGAAYFAYKAFAGTPQPTAGGASPAAGGAAPAQGGSTPASVTTATVTTPENEPVNASTLAAAASAQGLLGPLNPDQWNWITVNVLHAQAFILDAFGDVSQSSRTRTYTAQEFYDIVTGGQTPQASSQTATTQTCPPECGSDPVAGLTQILSAAAPGVSQYRPDEWNYFLNGYYNMDQYFGPVGQQWRDTPITAQWFAQVVFGLTKIPAATGVSGLGLVTADRRFLNNPILRPNIPGTRRWEPVARRAFVDTKRGWAV